jgi:hypothetical protein
LFRSALARTKPRVDTVQAKKSSAKKNLFEDHQQQVIYYLCRHFFKLFFFFSWNLQQRDFRHFWRHQSRR